MRSTPRTLAVAAVEAGRAQAVLVGAVRCVQVALAGAVRCVPVEEHDLRMSRIRSRVLAWATDLASTGAGLAGLAGATTGAEVIGRDMELVGVRRR